MGWLENAVVSMLAGAGVAVVAARIALRRFYRERWWDSRFACYSAIIGAFHDRSRHFDLILDQIEMQGAYSPEYVTRIQTASHEAAHTLKAQAAVADFLFTNDAAQIIRDYINDEDRALQGGEQHTSFDEAAILLRVALERVRVTARKDLQIGVRSRLPF